MEVIMAATEISLRLSLLTSICPIAMILAILLAATPLFAHGGKPHAAGAFTPLNALQKAVELYDKLVDTGKLEESWEIHLTKVEVSTRPERHGGKAYVVSFQRNAGEPKAVYIFFSADGKYAGSNFTGK